MKSILRALAFFIVVSGCTLSHASDNGGLPKFSNYSVNVYRGELKIPDYYKKIDGDWRDNMGKLVAPPAVNFAGKYYIGTHSCGSGCIYYTLSDLTTGADSNALNIFSSDGEHPQKTSDGRTYITSLVSQPDSKMLIAQYHIDPNATAKEECRERIFSLSDDGKQVRAITKTVDYCEQTR